MHSLSDILRKTAIPVLAALILWLTGGCEKNIDIDIDEIDPMIVLNATIAPDSVIEVTLSRTRHILDNAELSMLTTGTVEISDDRGHSATLVKGEDSRYRTTAFLPEEGATYTVKASAEGYYDVESSCTIPASIAIDRIDTTAVYSDYGGKQYNFEIHFTDPAGEKNYYALSMKALVYNEELRYEERWDTLYIDPEKDTVVVGWTIDTIRIMHPYYEMVYLQSEDLVIEEYSSADNGFVFSDKLFDGKSYTFKGSFQDYMLSYSADTATLYISLKSLDENYYRYLYSLQKHYYAKDDFFATPVVVYTNVTDGLGIFGSYSVDTDSMKFAPGERYYWEYYRK